MSAQEIMGRERLDNANIELGKELWAIKSSRDIYALIGLNMEAVEAMITTGKTFLAFVQHQSLAAMALGLAKVFEREKSYELCSVRGVYRLAKSEQIQNMAAVQAYASQYGITASEHWIRDIDQVFAKQEPLIGRHMRVIKRVRNTRLAHLQQNTPTSVSLPSIAAFDELLAFAFGFHAFVNRAFLHTTAHPILKYREIGTSLLALLKKTGVSEPVEKFEDEEPPSP
jgi:hypothetical protein